MSKPLILPEHEPAEVFQCRNCEWFLRLEVCAAGYCAKGSSFRRKKFVHANESCIHWLGRQTAWRAEEWIAAVEKR